MYLVTNLIYNNHQLVTFCNIFPLECITIARMDKNAL